MSGFNTDVRVEDDQYHVQTQVTRAGVETLVYLGGQVVYARRIADTGEAEATRQHQRIVGSLEDGSLDLFVAEGQDGAPVAESINGGAASGTGLLARLADFVRRQRKRRRKSPEFWIDAEALRRVSNRGNGSVTARLAFATGKPVAGASVEVERFELFGPSTPLAEVTTDEDGSLTFACEFGGVRPVGLILTSQWDGDEATARFLV